MNDYTDHHRLTNLVHALRPGGTLLRAWPLEGGVSAQVTAIEVALPGGDNERLVIRRHGAIDKGHNPDIASDEFRLLRVLHDAGLAVPVPVFVDEGSAFFDTPCLVVTFVEGSTGTEPTGTPGAMRQMADYLACLHALDLSCGDFSFLPRREDPVGGIRRHLSLLPQNARTDRLHQALATQPPFVGVGHHTMDAFTTRYLSRSKIDVASLPFWELCAATGMTAHMAKWGLDPDVEATMRRQAEAFIDQLLDQMTTRQGTTRR